jgi:hypothetical protein
MLMEITLLCEFFDIDQGLVEIGSDCELSFYYIFASDKFVPVITNSFDIIMTASKVLTQIQIQHTHHHIPAHHSITCQETDI